MAAEGENCPWCMMAAQLRGRSRSRPGLGRRCTAVGSLSRSIASTGGWTRDAKIFDFGLDEDVEEGSGFDIRTVTGDDGEERPAVIEKEDIQKGSYVMPSDLVASLAIKDASLSNLHAAAKIAAAGTDDVIIIGDFLDYVDENMHPSMAKGSGINYVEVGGTAMIRRSEDKSDSNVRRWMPVPPSGELPPYSPVYERHMHSFDIFLIAIKDIKKGGEVARHEDLWK